MATGYTPEEGQQLVGNLLFKNVDVNRGTGLELGLMTNASGIGTTTVLGDITEPTGGSYARISLTDGSWTVSSAGLCTYAEQTFTATGSDYSADVTGFFVCTTGTSPVLLRVQVEDSAVTMLQNDSYAVTLSLDMGTVAS